MKTPFEKYKEENPPYIGVEETLVVHNAPIEAADREYFLLIKTDGGVRVVPRPLVLDIVDVFAGQGWPDKLEMTFRRHEDTGYLYIHKWQSVIDSA